MPTKRTAAFFLALTMLWLAPGAAADSGGAKIKSLPESSALEAWVEVSHSCPGLLSEGTPCAWFAQATQYPSSAECPLTADSSHGVWVGPVEQTDGPSLGFFSFTPHSFPTVAVCLYVDVEGSSELVGHSHTFNLKTGREILPPPPGPPPTPEPSQEGLRYCEHPAVNGAFLSATPDVSCRTARAIRSQIFGLAWFGTHPTSCENRSYCVVKGFRCYGRYEGHLRRFSYAHRASCRSGRRRILADIG